MRLTFTWRGGKYDGHLITRADGGTETMQCPSRASSRTTWCLGLCVRLRGSRPCGSAISDNDIEAIHNRLDELTATWEQIPVGGALDLNFA
jgi:hypothetical protein